MGDGQGMHAEDPETGAPLIQLGGTSEDVSDLDNMIAFLEGPNGVCSELEERVKWSFEEEPDELDAGVAGFRESLEDRVLCRSGAPVARGAAALCMYRHTSTCTYTHKHKHSLIYTYIHIYMHTHTHTYTAVQMAVARSAERRTAHEEWQVHHPG